MRQGRRPSRSCFRRCFFSPSATSECTSFCGCHSLAHLLTLSQSLPDTTSTRDLTEWHKFDMDNIRLLRHASGDWGSSLMRAKSTQSSATPCKYVYNFGLHRQTSSMTDPTPQKDQLFSSAKKFSIGVPSLASSFDGCNVPRPTTATPSTTTAFQARHQHHVRLRSMNYPSLKQLQRNISALID